MKRRIQTACLHVYRGLLATRLFKTRVGKRLFITFYGMYKRRLEASTIESLLPWVTPGTTVVDVGANIGFFALYFARRVGANGRVIAIEPEARNLELLRAELARAGFGSTVEVVEGVAAEESGTLRLALNPYHPGDHRIADEGIPVRAWTVDEILALRGWPVVSVIKIDVQGSEIRVLRGARQTIERFHPSLFVEVDDRALAEAGFSADTLFDEIEGHDYRIYEPEYPYSRLTRSEAALSRGSLGYKDFLCR